MLKESLRIFRHNPLASTLIIVLIVAASMGQVLSLGSLFPILQMVTGGQSTADTIRSSVFGSVLAYLGAEVTLANLLLLFLAIGVAYSILNLLSEAVQGLHLRNLEVAIRHDLFQAIVSADWQYARAVQHGEVVNIISREAQNYRLVVKYVLYTVGSFIQCLPLFLYAFYLNWRLALFGTSIFGAGGLLLIPILRRSNRLGKEGPHIANRMSIRLLAALRSLKTAKALSLESFLMSTVAPSFQRSASNYLQANLLVSAQYAVMEIVAFIAIASMLYLGLVVIGVPQAELFVLLLLLFRALPQVRVGIDNYQRALTYFPSLEIINDHLSRARGSRSEPGKLAVSKSWKTIAFRNISFQFDDSAKILEGLDIQIRRGEFWAVLGPSGAGKTTVLDLLLGLLRPQRGEILVDETPLKDADLITWHSQLAYLGQESFVLAGTLRSNLLWGSDAHHTDAELIAALRAVRLDGLSSNEMELLDREVTENGSNLSGGEKQRLALARLFLRRPALVILDEPTTGLDAETERTIFAGIQQFCSDATLVVVTHREELAAGADNIVRFSSHGVTIESQKAEVH